MNFDPITPEKPKEYVHPEDQKINEHVKNIVRKKFILFFTNLQIFLSFK